MEKLLKKLLSLLLVIMVLPSFVMAERIESKTGKITEAIDVFAIDKIIIKNMNATKFSNYLGSGKAAVTFDATVVNGYISKVDFVLELRLFDANHNIVDISKTRVEVPAKSDVVFSKAFIRGDTSYDIDKIVYFTMVAEINDDMTIYNDTEKDNYFFQNYHLDINVNENNVYNVVETFDAVFNRYVETIRFGIPFRLRYTEDNGNKVNKRAVMTNIKTVPESNIVTEEGIRNIYLGDEQKEKDNLYYEVYYDYNVGEDKIKDKDEFVFYLVNDRDGKIDGLSFDIEMPSTIANAKVSFVDQHGTPIDSFTYDINDKKITGKIEGMINSGVQYAIKVELPDGYFKKASKNISDITITCLSLSIIFLALSIVVLVAQKKRDNSVKYNSIYFNDKINSLELGYLYNGFVRDRDIATLLISLANKGYIKINKTGKNYKILKVKEYDSDDRVEKVFMSELFLSGKSVTRKDLVTNVDYMKKNIEFKLQAHKKKNRLFILPVFNYKAIFWALVVLIFIFNTINIFFEYQPSSIMVNAILGSIGYIILFYGVIHEKVKIEKMLYIFIGLMLIITPLILTKYEAFIQDPLKLTTYIIGIISMMVIISITNMMGNRTFYGTKMYNKINAYKNFLISFDEVDKELDKNPSCFFEVLPYTFVLGISDRWFDKFKNRIVKKPSWYVCNDYSLDALYSDIKDIYSDIYISLKNSNK